jgi:hypothetical protein
MNLSFLPLVLPTLFASPAASLPAVTSPLGEVSLLAALPSDAFAVLHVPSPKALLASRETSRWVGFAMDAEWDSVLTEVVDSMDVDAGPGELSAWRERLLGSLADSSGVVGFACGEIAEDAPEPTIGLIVRGGEESSRLLRRFIGDDAARRPLPNGAEVLVSEAGRAELYYESNGLILVLSSPTIDESLVLAEECLNSMAAADEASLFDLPGIGNYRAANPAMEFVVDTTPFMEAIRDSEPDMDPFEQRAFESFASFRWVYSSFELGIGEEADWNLYAPYDKDSFIGSGLSFFGQADKSLFDHAPIESLSASVGAFDIKGFAAWVLGEIENKSEEDHANAMAGLSGIQSAMGVDLMDDIIGNMTGQFLGFSSAPDVNAATGMLSLVGMANTTTFAASLEETEPFLELVESLLSISGMGESVTSETRAVGSDGGEIELYQTAEEVGFDVLLGVGAGRLFFSTDPKTRASYFDLTGGKDSAKSIMDDPRRKAAVSGAEGAIITIQPTAGFADVVESTGELLELFMGEFIPDQDPELNPNGAEPDTSISTAAGKVADLIRRYFSGTMTGEVQIGDGLIHLRTIAR